MKSQKDFDLMIGELDRILSQLIDESSRNAQSGYNIQTLKHHAEDMQGAANKILENIGMIGKSKSLPEVLRSIPDATGTSDIPGFGRDA